jgi:hypothetical protein
MQMNFEERLQKNHAQCLNLWWNTETDFPPLGATFTIREQVANEREIDNFLAGYRADLNSISDEANIPGVFPDQKFHTAFEKLQNLRVGNIVSHPDLAKQFMDPFVAMAHDFIASAYQFDPNLKPADIRQALRNLWTAGSLQLILKQAPHFSQAIFAYSMLYPYTDNYLDDPTISLSIKRELNQKFQKRLAGEAFPCANPYEQTLDQLVGFIENQFPRPKFPDVYQSLLAIHQAQNLSLIFQLRPSLPYERDILGISFQKGGCSVLADGYLVRGDLTEVEAAFCFSYGVFLQLVDDLRDTWKDSQNGQMTVFSQIAARWPLDRLANRTIHFSRIILQSLETLEMGRIKELIQNSVTFLILEAIARNQNFYSKEYLNRIKKHTPFRLRYFRKLKAKLAKLDNRIPGGTLLRFALISRIKSESPGSIFR